VRVFVVLADMRGDVQAIFKETPHDKQVMMFSATLAKEIRGVCKKFMNKVRAPWKQDKLSTAGQPNQAPVAAASFSSSSIPSSSLQSCVCQQQRPNSQLHQLATALATGCRGSAAAGATPQLCNQLFTSPWWRAPAAVRQLPWFLADCVGRGAHPCVS
jgi:hypothetical protein